MTHDLTKRQHEIFSYIKDQIKHKGYPPTVREICKGLNIKSTSTVHGHLEKIEQKGYIKRDPTKPRAIEILINGQTPSPVDSSIIKVPLVGKVAAGAPILAQENIEDTFPVPYQFIDGNNHFMLTIQGESMMDAGILDGDYILVKQQNYASNGEIVVAMIDDEATVKRFFKEKNYFRLQPENINMDPILTDHVQILGIVKGVFRKL